MFAFSQTYSQNILFFLYVCKQDLPKKMENTVTLSATKATLPGYTEDELIFFLPGSTLLLGNQGHNGLLHETSRKDLQSHLP